MRVLVTGATGFIGTAVLRAIRDESVTVLVRDPTRLPTSLDVAVQVRADIADYMPGATFDRLIHLAWTGVDSHTSPENLRRNVEPQFTFLKRMYDAGTRDMTITGTCLEYGLQEGVLAESAAAAPVTEYAKAKNALRGLLEELPGLRLKWLRCFYVYGLGQRPQSILAQLLAAIARGDEAFDMSPGDQRRDFIHVDTLARNIVAVARQDKVEGIINAGSGMARPVVEFARAVLALKDSRMRLNTGRYPYPAHEPFSFCADVGKLKFVAGAVFDDQIRL